jgi:diguanylate cyclase (GGDEF)-like protein/PAS domain S-box-containing protein
VPDGSRPSTRLPQSVAAILESMTDAFVALDREWRYVYVNRRAGEMFDRTPEQLVGRHIWTEFPEGVGQPFHLAYERAMRDQETVVLEEYYPPYDRWFENRIYPSPEGLTIFFQDITERKRAEEEITRSEERYRALAHAFSSVVWRADGAGKVLQSETWSALTGRAQGTSDIAWLEAVHADDRERVDGEWQRSVQHREPFDCRYRVRVADGRWRHVHARGVPLFQGDELLEWIGVLDDVTEQLETEEALWRAALEDPLTGLANRTEFLARVSAALERRSHGPVAILFVDIDRFKTVNDAVGHEGGDRVLCTVAERLCEHVRPSDVVSRLSGDEFAVLCDGLTERAEGLAIARRIARAAREPAGPAGAAVAVSVGVAFAGEGERDAEQLLRRADAAMYVVKGRGGDGVEVFDEELREVIRRRARIEDELRAGLRSGDALDLHFQPVVSFRRGWASTAEALLRWRALDGSTLPAPDVVSVAEQSGLIAALGRAVLERACEQAVGWNAASAVPVAVSVNVSAQQLARGDELVEHVVAALDDSGLDAALLWLEITETMLVADQERSRVLLTRLRELGVKLALDDFGVGYSSLSYLHSLPVDAVKVDRSFIAPLPEDAGSARIVEAVVGIGRAFRAGVVAEGVETAEQLAMVRSAGCGGVQGFGLARPVPAAQLPAALATAEERARA